jgi:hypothetical protein
MFQTERSSSCSAQPTTASTEAGIGSLASIGSWMGWVAVGVFVAWAAFGLVVLWAWRRQGVIPSDVNPFSGTLASLGGRTRVAAVLLVLVALGLVGVGTAVSSSSLLGAASLACAVLVLLVALPRPVATRR